MVGVRHVDWLFNIAWGLARGSREVGRDGLPNVEPFNSSSSGNAVWARAGATHDEWAAAARFFFPCLRPRPLALRAAWPQIYRQPALVADSLAAAGHLSQPAAGQVAGEDGKILGS
jgi:hypothetical protein